MTTLTAPATRCRSCKAVIVFAKHHNGGRTAPFEEDPNGEWTIENGVAKHVGPPAAQLDLGDAPAAKRFTSHFARCPEAGKWRQR